MCDSCTVEDAERELFHIFARATAGVTGINKLAKSNQLSFTADVFEKIITYLKDYDPNQIGLRLPAPSLSAN